MEAYHAGCSCHAAADLDTDLPVVRKSGNSSTTSDKARAVPVLVTDTEVAGMVPGRHRPYFPETGSRQTFFQQRIEKVREVFFHQVAEP